MVGFFPENKITTYTESRRKEGTDSWNEKKLLCSSLRLWGVELRGGKAGVKNPYIPSSWYLEHLRENDCWWMHIEPRGIVLSGPSLERPRGLCAQVT